MSGGVQSVVVRVGLLCGLSGLLVALLTAAPALATTHRGDPPWRGRVSHVTDGDTVWVQPLAPGEPVQKIRLLGIDAPESCQMGGPEATAALKARLAGQVVLVKARARDDYGRLLARLSLQGQDVGGWLVSQGWAWSYRSQRGPGPYAKEEARAEAARRGVHAQARPMRPQAYRARYGSCKR